MKFFFDTVRPMFRRRRLNTSQVRGMERIVKAGRDAGLPRAHLAYVLATAFHETGQRMQPVREGFARSTAGAVRAVTNLYNRRVIKTNYALPHPKTGQSYFGRGDVQITWYENYLKFEKRLNKPLTTKPDLALDPAISAKIMIDGMKYGLFRKKKLDMIPMEPSLKDFTEARDIVNGDKNIRRNGVKIGPMIAQYAVIFWNALEDEYKKEIKDPKSPEPERKLWCSLMDFVGLGERSAIGD